MSLIDDIFGEGVGGILGPVAGIGASLWNLGNQNKARDDYASLIAKGEQEKFNNAQATRDAYEQYLNGALGIAGGNQAAQAAASQALLAAFGASEEGRLAAGGKAKKKLNKSKKKALKLLAPYRRAGNAMLPQAVSTATAGHEGLNLLNSYMKTPEQMAKLNQSGPTLELGAKRGYADALPSWIKRDK